MNALRLTRVLGAASGILLASIVTPSAREFCVKGTGAQAVDLSEHVSDKFIAVAKKIGVETVIRYYDAVDETLPGKTLHLQERQQIADSGLALLVVFQHHNNRFSTFTRLRGTSDASRSLVLAEENLQPKGSAVYFGVDGGWGKAKSEMAAVTDYFGAAAVVIRPAGFKMGAYASGLICSKLLEAGLIDFCWLANAKSWPGCNEFANSERWTMKQQLPEACADKQEVDFNIVGKYQNYGQFR